MYSADHDSSPTSLPEIATSGAPQPVLRRRRDALHRLEALVQLAPDATVVVDARGHIRLVNRQTEELFGYSAEELLGQPVELLVPERLRAAHQQHRAAYAAAPHARPFGANLPLSGQRRDGSEFPIEASLGPLDEYGESYVIVCIHDISALQWVHDARSPPRSPIRTCEPCKRSPILLFRTSPSTTCFRPCSSGLSTCWPSITPLSCCLTRQVRR